MDETQIYQDYLRRKHRLITKKLLLAFVLNIAACILIYWFLVLVNRGGPSFLVQLLGYITPIGAPLVAIVFLSVPILFVVLFVHVTRLSVIESGRPIVRPSALDDTRSSPEGGTSKSPRLASGTTPEPKREVYSGEQLLHLTFGWAILGMGVCLLVFALVAGSLLTVALVMLSVIFILVGLFLLGTVLYTRLK